MIAFALLAVLIATPATWPSVIASAHGGDTVALSGAADHLAVKNRTFDPPLTLDLKAATFVNLQLQDVTGLEIHGGAGQAKAGDWLGGFYGLRAHHVHVSGMVIAAADGPGAMVKDSTDVTFDHVSVDLAHTAIAFVNTDGFSVSAAALTRMSGDGVDAFSSRNGSVTFIACAGFRVLDATHRDCVQIGNTIAGAPAAANIEVADSVAHGDAQGFSAYSHSATDPGFKALSFHDLTAIVTDPNGVAIEACDGCTLKNNRVITLPGAQYRSHIWISGSANTDKCDNVAFAYGPKAEERDAACAAN